MITLTSHGSSLVTTFLAIATTTAKHTMSITKNPKSMLEPKLLSITAVPDRSWPDPMSPV